MAFCLIPKTATEFVKRLREGDIKPAELAEMSSAARRAKFQEFMDGASAKSVNSLFESKLLLKNQQLGMINWAKQVAGMKPQVLRDIISRIERMEEVLRPDTEAAFLEDLVAQKLGTTVTMQEATAIMDMSKTVSQAEIATRVKFDNFMKENTARFGEPKAKELLNQQAMKKGSDLWNTRIDYGTKLAIMKDYLGNLKLDATAFRKIDYIKHPAEAMVRLGGVIKSAITTLDNSFSGRQGIAMLMSHPVIWGKTFLKSWNIIGRELMGLDGLTPIKADVWSRPNALNGKYEAASNGYGLGVHSEEAFPAHLENVPVLGKVFKRPLRAAENAYNGSALRMRADYADQVIRAAEKGGIDMLNPIEASAHGNLVSSATGRGQAGRLTGAREVNVAMFSYRLLKSRFDILTAHTFSRVGGKNMTAHAHKLAAQNLAKIVGGQVLVHATAEMLHPGSTERDPASADFGKIKIGNTRFDTSGGLSSVATLMVRMTPYWRDGEFGWWFKSSTTGQVTKLGRGFGKRSPLDVLTDYALGKTSPMASVFRDIARQETFRGERPTFLNLLRASTVPLPIQAFQELHDDPNSANIWLALLMEEVGINTNTYGLVGRWETSESKTLQAFREQVGAKEFKDANDEFNRELQAWFNRTIQDPKFRNLSDERQDDAINKERKELQEKILRRHGYRAPREKPEKPLPNFR